MNEDRICCEQMRVQLMRQCDQHPDPNDCPDVLVTYDPKFDQFGIPIRDGGSSSLSIRYCPWCGVSFPDSKRDLWFDTLEQMGIDGPMDQDVPDEFKSDAWWRGRPTI